MISLVRKFGGLATAGFLALALWAQPALAQLRCFPSCSTTDGRFLVVASGTGLVTLSDDQLDLEIGIAAGTSSFQVGVFDGDAGDGGALAHWDFGSVPYEYTLYADPLANGAGTTVVQMQPGSPSILSTAMPDNARRLAHGRPSSSC